MFLCKFWVVVDMLFLFAKLRILTIHSVVVFFIFSFSKFFFVESVLLFIFAF